MALVITLVGLLESLIRLYELIVVLAIVVSWLAAFNVINPRNEFVRAILRVLLALTEPLFRPIRRYVPIVAGVDFSALVVLIVLATVNFFLHVQFGNYEFF